MKPYDDDDLTLQQQQQPPSDSKEEEQQEEQLRQLSSDSDKEEKQEAEQPPSDSKEAEQQEEQLQSQQEEKNYVLTPFFELALQYGYYRDVLWLWQQMEMSDDREEFSKQLTNFRRYLVEELLQALQVKINDNVAELSSSGLNILMDNVQKEIVQVIANKKEEKGLTTRGKLRLKRLINNIVGQYHKIVDKNIAEKSKLTEPQNEKIATARVKLQREVASLPDFDVRMPDTMGELCKALNTKADDFLKKNKLEKFIQMHQAFLEIFKLNNTIKKSIFSDEEISDFSKLLEKNNKGKSISPRLLDFIKNLKLVKPLFSFRLNNLDNFFLHTTFLGSVSYLEDHFSESFAPVYRTFEAFQYAILAYEDWLAFYQPCEKLPKSPENDKLIESAKGYHVKITNYFQYSTRFQMPMQSMLENLKKTRDNHIMSGFPYRVAQSEQVLQNFINILTMESIGINDKLTVCSFKEKIECQLVLASERLKRAKKLIAFDSGALDAVSFRMKDLEMKRNVLSALNTLFTNYLTSQFEEGSSYLGILNDIEAIFEKHKYTIPDEPKGEISKLLKALCKHYDEKHKKVTNASDSTAKEQVRKFSEEIKRQLVAIAKERKSFWGAVFKSAPLETKHAVLIHLDKLFADSLASQLDEASNYSNMFTKISNILSDNHYTIRDNPVGDNSKLIKKVYEHYKAIFDATAKPVSGARRGSKS